MLMGQRRWGWYLCRSTTAFCREICTCSVCAMSSSGAGQLWTRSWVCNTGLHWSCWVCSQNVAYQLKLLEQNWFIQALGRVCQGVLPRGAFQRLVSSTAPQKMKVYGLHLGEAGQQCAWYKERARVTAKNVFIFKCTKKLKLRTVALAIPPG